MKKQFVKEFDVISGLEIEREMTVEEMEQWQIEKTNLAARLSQEKLDTERRISQKNALLEKLGITEEEAKLLLS